MEGRGFEDEGGEVRIWVRIWIDGGWNQLKRECFYQEVEESASVMMSLPRGEEMMSPKEARNTQGSKLKAWLRRSVNVMYCISIS